MFSHRVELREFHCYTDSTLQVRGILTRVAMTANPQLAAHVYVPQKAANDLTHARSALGLTWQTRSDVRCVTSAHSTEWNRFYAMAVGKFGTSEAEHGAGLESHDRVSCSRTDMSAHRRLLRHQVGGG